MIAWIFIFVVGVGNYFVGYAIREFFSWKYMVNVKLFWNWSEYFIKNIVKSALILKIIKSVGLVFYFCSHFSAVYHFFSWLIFYYFAGFCVFVTIKIPCYNYLNIYLKNWFYKFWNKFSWFSSCQLWFMI